MDEYDSYAILYDDNYVINIIVYSKNPEPGCCPQDILATYPNCKMVKYGENITKNDATVGSTYNEEFNAFIRPKPDPTYVLNQETFEWEPDKNIEYDIHGDGVMYKWLGEEGWQLAKNS